MNYTHIGWTPCINGHLNFGLMAPGIFGGFTNSSVDDKKRTAINYGYKHQDDHHTRRIILQSKVDWKDNQISQNDGNFRVILTAETNESNNLDDRHIQGAVYIYPLAQEPAAIDGKINLPWFNLIHDANRRLSEYKAQCYPTKNIENWKNTQNKLNEIYDNLTSCLEKNNSTSIKEHYYKVNFQVNCRGLTKLSIATASNSSSDYIILRQAFYYIKYSLHSHKHHYAEEDSLTTIIQIQTDSGEKSEIGLRLIGQLKRELTNIKRTYSSGGSKVFCDEQGIIAYMKSFYITLLKDGYLTEDLYDREVIYLNSIQSSFSVQTDKQQKKGQKITEIKNTYRTKLAILFSCISIFWITVLQHFTDFSKDRINIVQATFIESVFIFITFILCLYFSYKHQVNKAIKNTLDTSGLKTWVEQYYITQEKEFKKLLLKKKFTAVVIFIITAVFFFASPLLVKNLL